MFSFHLMIANMLGYIPSKCNTIVNVDNYLKKGLILENKTAEISILFAHLYLLLELQI